jgi:hypothetical protein
VLAVLHLTRVVGLLIVSAGLLWGCESGVAYNPISQPSAIRSALLAVQDLERDQARQTSTPTVRGFAVVIARLTHDTSSVSDSHGNELIVRPAPREAWVVELAAPSQGIWRLVSAVAEVDSTTGMVAGTGLWAVPLDQPVKAS